MILIYTNKLSEADLFIQTYMKDYKQRNLEAQALHMFDNTAIYFEKYPQKFRIIHINKKQRSQLFFNIDKYFFENQKESKQIYVYVLHLINSDKKIIFFSLNGDRNPRANFKVAGLINSQIAAVNKIVESINKNYGDSIIKCDGRF